ncbi:AtpZ/AtpI family protein [Patescibacteria group bacterium]|nr:AtpZ/AtpI family protein [Patescibacteria group bacterium]MBU1922508.1 AtpZ/AtpI family protein [Patescibacteria group bacterium]
MKITNLPWKSLNLAFSMVGILLILVLGAAFLGRWLDNRYDSAPWFFIGLTLAAFIVANIFIIMKSVKAMSEIEKDNLKNRDER